MPSVTFSAQESLLQYFEGEPYPRPEPPAPAILGATFDRKLDGERLGSQQRRVEELMQDGEWRTLHEIAAALRRLYKGTHFPEASISARLRDMRRAGYQIEHKRKTPAGGLRVYRAIKAGVAA